MSMECISSVLREGEIIACARLLSGSNQVFLLTFATEATGQTTAVYKPRCGESPLFDFRDGTLYKREYAAYVVSLALGWGLVPPPVIRSGPRGIGTVQWFVESKKGSDFFTVRHSHRTDLERIAVFDCVVNNADRKWGHCIEDTKGRVWAIDHGLTFNVVPKLRTVIWDFSGQPIPTGVLADLEALQTQLSSPSLLARCLSVLLTPEEIRALKQRLEALLSSGAFPQPGPYRCTPWPPI